MNNLIVRSNSTSETKFIAEKIADFIEDSAFIALYGEMGAGKTDLSRTLFLKKGFTSGFSSPTFTLIKEYAFNEKKAYHLDVYRLEDVQELDYLGYYDCMTDSVLTVVEWADKIANELPERRYDISIRVLGENKRNIEIKCTYRELNELEESLNEYLVN